VRKYPSAPSLVITTTTDSTRPTGGWSELATDPDVVTLQKPAPIVVRAEARPRFEAEGKVYRHQVGGFLTAVD
jgi:hypothetical protein